MDALSRNPVGSTADDDDFGAETKTLQVIQMMESFSIPRQGRKQTGSVSTPISCICSMVHQQEICLRNLFQKREQCQRETNLSNVEEYERY